VNDLSILAVPLSQVLLQRDALIRQENRFKDASAVRHLQKNAVRITCRKIGILFHEDEVMDLTWPYFANLLPILSGKPNRSCALMNGNENGKHAMV
jgi:hypothetical protein